MYVWYSLYLILDRNFHFLNFGKSTNMFFNILDRFSPIVSLLLIASGVILVLIYLIKKSLLKGFKDKYNLISRYEIKVIWYASLFWLLAMVVYPKSIVSKAVKLNLLLDFTIVLILGLSMAFAIFYLLKHYYPDFLNRRLKRLRYKPRISPKTGKPMKLLSEEEEDVYLDEGMQAEEDVFSTDYDVWIDEETGYTQIEKYSGKMAVSECPSCGYQTLKVQKEELIIAPTSYASGELMKRYKCLYCGHLKNSNS